MQSDVLKSRGKVTVKEAVLSG